MHEGDSLLVISQVSLGLVGFGALIIAMQPRPLSTWRAPDQFRFQNFITSGLIASMAGILPGVLFFLLGDADLSFRTASGLYGLILGGRTVSRFRMNIRLLSTQDGGRVFNKGILLILMCLFYLGVLALLANAFSLIPLTVGGVYLAVLYLNLAMSVIIFFRLLMSTTQPDEE